MNDQRYRDILAFMLACTMGIIITIFVSIIINNYMMREYKKELISELASYQCEVKE